MEKKAVEKKPRASKEANSKAKISVEGTQSQSWLISFDANHYIGSNATSALSELDKIFDRKTVLQGLRDKLPRKFMTAYDRYLVKVDADIERWKTEML